MTSPRDEPEAEDRSGAARQRGALRLLKSIQVLVDFLISLTRKERHFGNGCFRWSAYQLPCPHGQNRQ